MKITLRGCFARGHTTEVDMVRCVSSTEELPTTRRIVDSLSSICLLEPFRNDRPTSNPPPSPTLYTPPSSTSSNHGSTHSASSSLIDVRFPTPTLAELTDALDGLTYTSVSSSEFYRRTTALSIPVERRHAAFYPNGVTFPARITGTHAYSASDLTCDGTVLPSAVPARQRARRPRRPTLRPENLTSDDPPPTYAAFDPHPFFKTGPKNRRGVLKTIRNDGLKVTTERVGRRVIRHVEDVGKIAKDLSTAVKGAQVKLNTKRAKSKIRWLEKNDFLSGQDRFLTRELVG